MIKQVVKKTYRLFQYLKWLALGKPLPPNSYVKQYFIRKAFLNSGLNVYIETGTLHGRTLEVLAPIARNSYGIELDKSYFEITASKFSAISNVQIFHGDSGVELSRLLKDLKEPSFFWLDAHFSGGDTAKAAIETPILNELEAILNHPIKQHIIWIDDARCFDGTNDYPTLDQIRKKMSSYHFELEDDIIKFS